MHKKQSTDDRTLHWKILFAATLHTKVYYSSKPVGAQTLRETGVDAK